jgi:membrane-associated PAP2 superfamily phosphatase
LNNSNFQRVFWQRSFWLPHLVLPVIAGLLLVFIYPHTSLDAWLIRPFYDAHALVFPLKNDSFLENVMHKGLRNLMIVVSLMMLGFWIFGLKICGFVFKRHNGGHWSKVYHRQFLWIFVAMVISTSAISVLKRLSIHSCPWNLLPYGGTQPWIPLFGNLPAAAEMGHCFPGGHASGGFALIAFYFGFRDSLSKLANAGLILGLLFGFVMGWGQMMRGAHFMSHNLWTAWVVWMILLVQYLMWSPKALAAKV